MHSPTLSPNWPVTVTESKQWGKPLGGMHLRIHQTGLFMRLTSSFATFHENRSILDYILLNYTVVQATEKFRKSRRPMRGEEGQHR